MTKEQIEQILEELKGPSQIKLYPTCERKPYCCPVCEGRGIVPYNFYGVGYGTTTNITPVTCKTCNGEGIVWG